MVLVTDEWVELWVMFCAAGGLCGYSWYWCIRSIIFYRKNDYDFSQDVGPKIYWSARGGDDRLLATPRAKFLIAMPFSVLASSSMLLFTVLALAGIIKPCLDCRP
ncbi:hypothetical protein [Rhizobium sp. K102]|jgi:hypothetical protein|uniref:hypothetical protein n=1 Tax=Rhizobium sp. K102 TaxID=2918527 RepID=UPI001EFB4E4E|nr:hypothetical protein [Rhizobium sp. K102]ULR45055.1 hypothetical protein MHI61_07460 [Rhizobium sp. K102]